MTTAIARPDTIASVLGDEAIDHIVLIGEFPAIKLTNHYVKALVVDAHKAVVKGLTITGSNIVWRGGTIKASGGKEANAYAGYGLFLKAAKNVAISGVWFTDANRGIVPSACENLEIAYCLFDGIRQDGVIAAQGSNLRFIGNTFRNFAPRPTTCKLADGSVVTGLSSAGCTARGGVWTDGDHSDAIQLRNGINGVYISGNVIEGISQGIGQMEAVTDLPLNDVVIVNNSVSVTGFHSITIGPNSTNVVCIGNTIRQMTGRKTNYKLPLGAVNLENVIAP